MEKLNMPEDNTSTFITWERLKQLFDQLVDQISDKEAQQKKEFDEKIKEISDQVIRLSLWL